MDPSDVWVVRHVSLHALVFTLAAAHELGPISEQSVPIYFYQTAASSSKDARFVAQAPQLRALFQKNSVKFHIRDHETVVRFLSSRSDTRIEPGEVMSGRANFLFGNDESRWRTNVPLYGSLTYRNLYSGIDLQYGGNGARIKSEFVVSPEADPNQIRLRYNGQVSMDLNGDLLVSDGDVTFRELAPEIFQESRSGRQRISGTYHIFKDRSVGFEIGSYDRSRPLVIDPVVSYSTYFGGSGMTNITGVATDGTGAAYVTGWTESLDLPIAGAMQAVNRGGVDAFVAKLSPAGDALLYATYIGGNSDDRAAAIAVDGLGQAYITGSTASINFPVVAPIRAVLGAPRNGFVLKLNASGSALLFSTYLGGTTWDTGNAIALDASGNVYVAGDTQSRDFPMLNAVQNAFGGVADAFVTKLTASGSLSFSTFLGGSAAEHAGGIAVDSSGNVYVTGGTYSVNFPIANAIQPFNAGGQDAFVTKISGGLIAYSTYLGGSQYDQANAIALDAGGNVYLTGVTTSPNFPTTSGALRTAINAVQDAFVTKMSAGGALSYSTLLGGSTSNLGSALAVDSSGDAYVVGNTSSVDFPLVNSLQTSFNNMLDAFIAELNPLGTALLWSSLYGGSGPDSANSIALDASGDIFVAGQTNSTDFPLQSALRSVYTGAPSGFVMRVAPSLSVPTNPSPANGAAGITIGTLSWSASGATSFDIYLGTTPTPGYSGTTASTSYTPPALAAGQTYYWYVVAKNGGNTKASPVWSFTTQVAVLAAPSNPSPATGATGVTTAISLSWSATAATSFDFYFGTTSTPAYVTTITAPSYSPGALQSNQTYYWQVVAHNASSSAASPIWSFTTQGNANPTVPNGGFETGALAPWSIWSGSAFLTTTAHSGSYGLIMIGTAQTIVYEYATGLTPGQAYQVSVWVKGNDSTAYGALLILYGQTSSSSAALTVTSTWQQMSATLTVGSDGKLAIDLVQWANAAGATTYWDDVAISSLVPNGGFETGSLAPWSIWSGNASLTTAAHSGSYGLMMTGTAQDIAYEYVTGLIPGRTYTVSVWVKGSDSTPYGALLVLYGANSTSSAALTVGPSWNQMSTTLTVGADGTLAINLVQWANSSGATTYWDDVMIQ